MDRDLRISARTGVERLAGSLGSISAMSPMRRLLLATAGIMILTAAGTVGFMLIEKMSLIDALYMTVITISTVGYGEVKRLSPAGRLFTVGLIVFGVGNAAYLLAVVAEVLIEGRLREYMGATAMQRKIHELQGHVIICGFGRFGRVVVEELTRHSVPIVVIDPDVSKSDELARLNVLHLAADATTDDVLMEAGVAQARAIVVATSSDADNVYITLSAREKNHDLMIHARGESEGGMRRLKLAGADQVISAYQRGGMRVASTILRPSLVDFLELIAPGRGDEVDLEQLRIEAGSPMVGRSIGAIEKEAHKLRIVALKRDVEPIVLIPESDAIVHSGDYLVVIGDRASLRKLAEIVES